MKLIPIKPEHQARFRYYQGEIYRLQKNGSEKAIVEFLKNLADTQLLLYPEIIGLHTCINADCTAFEIYESDEEFHGAILEEAERVKETPYIVIAKEEGDYDVLGPEGKK